jgi:hypothetical protein
MTAAVSLHQPLMIEYRIIRPDGAVRHLYARAEVALAPSDAVVVAGLRGICQDVTGRTLATVDQGRELIEGIGGVLDLIERLEKAGLRSEQVADVAELRRAAEQLLTLVDPHAGEGTPDPDTGPDPQGTV